MDQKIIYFSGLPSDPETTIETLTKQQIEQKFGIQWCDFVGHPYVGIANMGKSGRGLFATNDISEGTTLFHYNKTLHFGENLRNYGSYMQHAPQAEELEAYNLEFKTTEQPKIATQNSELKKKGEELIAVATKNIKKNEILVHSYQHNYWIEHGSSPSLFTTTGETIDPSQFLCGNIRVCLHFYYAGQKTSIGCASLLTYFNICCAAMLAKSTFFVSA